MLVKILLTLIVYFIIFNSLSIAQLIQLEKQKVFDKETNSGSLTNKTAFDDRVKTVFPDFIIEKVYLDNQNRIVFKIKNKTKGIPDISGYTNSRIKLTYGLNTKDYSFEVIDPFKKLLRPEGEIIFTSDIILDKAVMVTMEVDFNQRIKEENESNNILSANLTPRIVIVSEVREEGSQDTHKGLHKKREEKAVAQSVNLISPNGGQIYKIGEKIIFQWQWSGPHTDVEVALKNDQRRISLYRCSSENQIFQWSIPKNIPVGSYKAEIVSSDGKTKDESDGWFNIDPPEVDLQLCVESPANQKFYTHDTYNITVKVRNEGTKVLNNVLIEWIVIDLRKNSVLKQESAGFGVMYPGYFYEHTITRPPFTKIEIFVDRQNLQGEPESLRYDNHKVYKP
ncbi:MAG: hypothetical protein N2606_02675 [Candidatus Omnitrophica bacterium]|nr:hypothetical protein [Candidatus Omnitrophota bacterium]